MGARLGHHRLRLRQDDHLSDRAEQTRQAFRNIEAALGQAGLTLRDVVRVRYFLTRPEDFELLGPVFGEFLSEIRPAATAIVCQLIDPRMLLEIEVTARGKPKAAPRKRPTRPTRR